MVKQQRCKISNVYNKYNIERMVLSTKEDIRMANSKENSQLLTLMEIQNLFKMKLKKLIRFNNNDILFIMRNHNGVVIYLFISCFILA